MENSSDMCNILKEYLNYHTKYTEKYGDKTIVIMMCGQFYEIYGVNTEVLQIGPNLSELSEILNIAVARRNKNIKEISYNNYQMMGWPDHSLLKFKNILLTHGYTIIKVDQITAPPNPERAVTEIISPATCIDSYERNDLNDPNFLCSVYIDNYPLNQIDTINVAGLSFIDVSTGNNYVHRVHSSKDDTKIWNDEIYRFIQYYNPKEIIIHFNTNKFSFNQSELSKLWEISEEYIYINLINSPEYHKLSYQNQFLQKIFKNEDCLSPIEYLGFERDPEITMSYIYMIQFIYEHKIENTLSLQKPEFKENNKYLLLSHNCIEQLNIVDNKNANPDKYSSLLKLLNKCSTAIGRRLCKERLLYPILDTDKLTKRYDTITHFRSKYEEIPIYEICNPLLRKIIDIEKLHRKMSITIINPYEFYSLHISYRYIQKIILKLSAIPLIQGSLQEYSELDSKINSFITEYLSIFNIDELEKYSLQNMETSVFNKGIYEEIDQYDSIIYKNKTTLKLIADKLGFYIDKKKEDIVKTGYTDKYGWHLYMTKNRSDILKKNLKNLIKDDIEIKDGINLIKININEIKTVVKGSSYHLDLPIIHKLSGNILLYQKKLQVINREKYLDKIKYFHTKYSPIMSNIVTYIGLIDLNSTMAKISIENIYTRPEIILTNKSQFYAKEIRHPIVECIQTDTEYIPNDISLNQDGILLYGTNACGKSTLMKSIGLTLIMAQAGFFVPCSELKYSPYTQLFTRILNNDNLFRGQSTFAVEMSELRSIILRSNNKSLVLGDELCSGTENVSALSIVASGLKTLSNIKCSFIFTSHLHQLMDLSMIKTIPNLNVFHLKIIYDIEKDILIYDRKLTVGSGPPIYGLEVCKAMGLDKDFLDLARSVQLEITGSDKNLLIDHQSNYNSDVFMDQCEICKDKAQETHHINEQNIADGNGNINHFHKNTKHNLVPLCKKCHNNVTYGTLRIYGYIDTYTGKKLNYEYSNQSVSLSKKKYSEEQTDLINECWSNTKSKKECISKLELNHNIKLSITTFNKIITDSY